MAMATHTAGSSDPPLPPCSNCGTTVRITTRESRMLFYQCDNRGQRGGRSIDDKGNVSTDS